MRSVPTPPQTPATPTTLLHQGHIIVAWRTVPGDARLAKQVARELCRTLFGSLNPDGIHVSRTGTAGLAGVAACRDHPIGLDAEAPINDATFVDPDLLDLALHPNERRTIPTDVPHAFPDLWSRKEAVLKALGVGLSTPPHTVSVGWRHDQWQPIVANGRAMSVLSIPTPTRAAAALAVTLPEARP